MDGLIALVVVVLAVAQLFGRARKKSASQPGRPAQPGQRPSPAAQPEKPQSTAYAPVNTDSGRHSPPPIHWEGTRGEDSSIPALTELPLDASYSYESTDGYDAQMHDPGSLARRKGGRSSDEAHSAPTASSIPGLDLRLDGDTMVKGVIFAEILNRGNRRRSR